MAYETTELLKKAKTEIEKKKLIFHTDVFMALAISSSTYYFHFAKESNEYKEIEEALAKNRLALKAGIRNKWYNSKSDMGGLYLYKLCATPEEREILSTNYNKNELSGSLDASIDITSIDFSKLSTEALKEIRALALQKQLEWSGK